MLRSVRAHFDGQPRHFDHAASTRLDRCAGTAREKLKVKGKSDLDMILFDQFVKV